MVAPVFSPTVSSGHAPTEEDYFFCGCCRVPYPSAALLTSVSLPRNVTCAGCGKQHISQMNVCPSCLEMAEADNLSDLTRHAYGESRPERRRLARFLISAVKEHRVRK